MTEDPGTLLRAADEQVARLIAAARMTRIQLWTLTAVCVILVIGYVAGGFLVAGEFSLTHKVQDSAVSGCQQGNAERAADKANWDFFLALLLKGNTSPTDQAEARQLEAHIARADAPRDCAREYGGK